MRTTLFCLWIFTRWVQPDTTEPNVVARVNNTPIQQAELIREMNRYRAEVYTRAPATPAYQLKRKALKALICIKVQEACLKQYHLWPYQDYNHFLLMLKQTNNQRRNAANTKQAVYGPVTYDEITFFDYSFSNAVLRLQQLTHINDKAYRQFIRKRMAQAKVISY